MPNQYTPKITDEQFVAAFKQCKGNFAKTARFIQSAYGVYYTRQAVYVRARKHSKDIMKIIRKTDIKQVDHLLCFIDDESLDPRFRVRHYLQVINQCDKMNRLSRYANRNNNQFLA